MRKSRDARVVAATAVLPLSSSGPIARLANRFRPARRMWHLWERTIPFLVIAFSKDGLGSRDGRTLILGKFRRMLISTVPPLARALQKKYGIQGSCTSCGASCRLLFQCPHWDSRSHLCSVYEDRPSICRLFPITPGDIKERDIVLKSKSCGFTFKKS